jgi:RNA recognition motif-containing protein
MMKNIFTLSLKKALIGLVFFCATISAQAQIVNIPDANFKAALVANPAINNIVVDGEIQVSEAIAFNGIIDVNDSGIFDLTGIEAFINLTELNCSHNSLDSIDVSANTALTNLNCSYNSLDSIDISYNTALTAFNCDSNLIASLDVSTNVLLTHLLCRDNLLTSLDVSANPLLYEFRCSRNQITALDVSNKPDLFLFACAGNLLTSIDVSTNFALNGFFCNENLLDSLDISSNTQLVQFWCYNNQLDSLDVSNNPNLGTLECRNNFLTSLDLSANVALFELACGNNPIVNLDLSQNIALTTVICSNMASLSSLNIQNGTNGIITNFDASNNPSLSCIQVDNVANAIGAPNWSEDATAIYSLNCSYPCASLPAPQFTVKHQQHHNRARHGLAFTNNTPNLGAYDFLWHFGDGSAINDDNATVDYTYNTNGNFSVSLTLNDPLTGCSITNYDAANAAQTVVCNVPAGNICGFTPLISPNGVINACQGSTC